MLATVHSVFSGSNMNLPLRNILYSTAVSELESIQARFDGLLLQPLQHDRRTMRSSNSPFTSRAAYLLRFQGRVTDPFATSIWDNFAPSRCRIFIWLVHKGRIRTRDFLFSHGWLDTDECPICNRSETIAHLFLHCPKEVSFWTKLGVDLSTVDSVQNLWQCNSLPWVGLPSKVRSTLVIVAIWNLWKARNRMVFDHPYTTTNQLLFLCREDIRLWSHRANRVARNLVSPGGRCYFFHYVVLATSSPVFSFSALSQSCTLFFNLGNYIKFRQAFRLTVVPLKKKNC